MNTPGVDYAWFNVSVADLVKALHAAGMTFVCRYLSHDSGKNLSPGEARALSDAGIEITVVWETTATRAGDGYAAGRQDAHDAVLQAEACGMPADRPIYFAVDYDAAPSDVKPYFEGVVSVLGAGRSGVYGGIRVVRGLLDAGLVHWGWQASAWSYGAWEPRAQIRQLGQHTIGGVDCDDNVAMFDDIGAWRVGVSPAPAPTPQPQQEDEMPTGQLNRHPTNPTDKKNTTISIPAGHYKAIGFAADSGFLGHPPVKLRVALHLGGGNWQLHEVVVDSHKDKPTVNLDAKCDAVSVTYEDDGAVPVGWDMS